MLQGWAILAAMYRDEDEAARLRIATLEAKLAERDAALAARDAELGELRASVTRLAPEQPPATKPRGSLPILVAGMAILIGLSLMIVSGMGPRARPGRARSAVEPRTTTNVAACDEYLFRVELCLSRLDPSVRESLSTSLRATREAWGSAGDSPASRDALATSCRQALDNLAMNPLCD